MTDSAVIDRALAIHADALVWRGGELTAGESRVPLPESVLRPVGWELIARGSAELAISGPPAGAGPEIRIPVIRPGTARRPAGEGVLDRLCAAEAAIERWRGTPAEARARAAGARAQAEAFEALCLPAVLFNQARVDRTRPAILAASLDEFWIEIARARRDLARAIESGVRTPGNDWGFAWRADWRTAANLARPAGRQAICRIFARHGVRLTSLDGAVAPD